MAVLTGAAAGSPKEIRTRQWEAVREALRDPGPDAQGYMAQVADESDREAQKILRWHAANETVRHARADLETTGLTIGEPLARAMARWVATGMPTAEEFQGWLAAEAAAVDTGAPPWEPRPGQGTPAHTEPEAPGSRMQTGERITVEGLLTVMDAFGLPRDTELAERIRRDGKAGPTRLRNWLAYGNQAATDAYGPVFSHEAAEARKAARPKPAPAAKPAKPAKPLTYDEAKKMLLAGLAAHGWEIVAGQLKKPWASKQGHTLWFHPQAIYYAPNKDYRQAHSLTEDMRKFATVEDLLRAVERYSGSAAVAAPPAEAPSVRRGAPAVGPLPVDTGDIDARWEEPAREPSTAPRPAEPEPASEQTEMPGSVREPPSGEPDYAKPADVPPGPEATVWTDRRVPVTTLARLGDLFVHANVNDPTTFAVSEDRTGLRAGSFDTLDEARAFMWELNTPEIRPVVDRVLAGVVFVKRGKEVVPEPTDAASEAGTEFSKLAKKGLPTRLARWRAAVRAGTTPRERFAEEPNAAAPSPGEGQEKRTREQILTRLARGGASLGILLDEIAGRKEVLGSAAGSRVQRERDEDRRRVQDTLAAMARKGLIDERSIGTNVVGYWPLGAAPTQAAPAPHRLSVAEKASALWAAFSPNERAGVPMGLFPATQMQQAAREGYDGRALSVAMMERARHEEALKEAAPEMAGAEQPPPPASKPPVGKPEAGDWAKQHLVVVHVGDKPSQAAPHGSPAGRPERVRAALQDAAAGARRGQTIHVGESVITTTLEPWHPPGALTTGEAPTEPSIVDALSPVEHRTAAARRDANIKAMWLAADLEKNPRPLTDEDRLTLAAYSDWGGVGIDKWASKFPPGFPVPDARQLIDAYYTPTFVCTEIARVLRPLLAGLETSDGKIHALDPAVGIGRFPLALSGPGFENVEWHAVEYSELSYRMLHALRPDIDLFNGPFERWVAQRGPDFAGRLKLLISNPPYGKRPPDLTDDPDRRYRYKRADQYFLRRGLDLLAAGGLGVFIIPSGFLTAPGDSAAKLRDEVLRRHHLAAAFRLPNEVWSLANLVTDILFFRSRGTEIDAVDEADRFVLEGRYYEQFPHHILGTVVRQDKVDPETGKKKRGWHESAEGYTVVGEFKGLPPTLEERPICGACLHAPAPEVAEPPQAPVVRKQSAAEQLVEQDDRLAAAISLGRRVEAFLASVGDPDVEPIGWEELHRDLVEWAAANGGPGKDKAILDLAAAERGPNGKAPPGGAGWLLKAFESKSPKLIGSLADRPKWMPRFVGNGNDPVQVGEYLYRANKTLEIQELPGGDPTMLFAAGWCEDSTDPAWTERLDHRGQLLPPDEYLYGQLWPRFDRAQARAALGDAQAAAQAKRLMEVINPATYDEIEVSPQDAFIPLGMLEEWLATQNYKSPVKIVREKGLVQVEGVAYDKLGDTSLAATALWCVGWINHDYALFKPGSDDDAEEMDKARLRYGEEWTQSFRGWLDAVPERQRVVEHAYQRARQGFRAHNYGSEPLRLARWNPAIVLNHHQIAGARRLDANRGGGLGYAVGVGKTYTILAALALARQAGRARRPVLVVPQPIAFQWVTNIGKALPGFRVVVIGIDKTHKRDGADSSKTDSPEARSRKWARFQGGEYDLAILTYDSLPRTAMDRDSMLKAVEGVAAVEREIELRKRNAKVKRKSSPWPVLT